MLFTSPISSSCPRFGAFKTPEYTVPWFVGACIDEIKDDLFDSGIIDRFERQGIDIQMATAFERIQDSYYKEDQRWFVSPQLISGDTILSEEDPKAIQWIGVGLFSDHRTECRRVLQELANKLMAKFRDKPVIEGESQIIS